VGSRAIIRKINPPPSSPSKLKPDKDLSQDKIKVFKREEEGMRRLALENIIEIWAY
jgi:hypothetical protein